MKMENHFEMAATTVNSNDLFFTFHFFLFFWFVKTLENDIPPKKWKIITIQFANQKHMILFCLKKWSSSDYQLVVLFNCFLYL